MGGYYAELNVNLNINEVRRATSPQSRKKKKSSSGKTSATKVKSSKSASAKYGKKLVALGIATASYANSKVGDYTGNKVRQQNIASGIGVLTTIGTAFVNPVAAATVAGIYTVKRTIDMGIERENSRQESEYRNSYRGKATTSKSRWG